jgi:hypothetical protein
MILIIAGLLFVTCKTENIPQAYNFRMKETKGNPYGCWITATFRSDAGMLSVSGELIYLDLDTTYILLQDRMIRPVSSGTIKEARVFTHKNQAGTYLLITTLYLIPNIIGMTNEFAADFMEMAIPTAVTGLTSALIEGMKERNILKYPGQIEFLEMKNLARYPGAKPEKVDFHQLTLKTASKKKT